MPPPGPYKIQNKCPQIHRLQQRFYPYTLLHGGIGFAVGSLFYEIGPPEAAEAQELPRNEGVHRVSLWPFAEMWVMSMIEATSTKETPHLLYRVNEFYSEWTGLCKKKRPPFS